MTAPTIQTKVTADTAQFDKSMKDVAKGVSNASHEISKFGTVVKIKGDKSLSGFSDSIKKTISQLKPLGVQVAGVAKSMAKWGAASVAAAGVAGAAIVGTSLASIKELRNLAKMADVSTASLQRGGFAAQSIGIETEKYADILKDVNDRLGDFAATGAGPMIDFFEQIAPKVGITAAAFEGLNSEQSLALFVKSLEDANVSQAEMTFYMEAIASNATKLIPLFTNNAKAMKQLKDEAKALGIGLSEIDVKQAMNAQEQLSRIGAIIKNELMSAVVEIAPFITAVAKKMVNWFKDVRAESGGLAGMMQRFTYSIAGYIDSIGTVLAYVGKSFDVVRGSFNMLVGNIKIAVGAVMNVIGAVVQGAISPILKGIQFVTNAFSGGFLSGITNTLKMVNLKMREYLLYPVEKLFQLLAKLPDDFGGDLFKKSLKDIQAMQSETQKWKEDLTNEVMAPNIDIDTPMGEFNALFDNMRTKVDTFGEGLLDSGGDLITGGFDQGVAGGQSILDGLTSIVNPNAIKETLAGVMSSVREEMINKPNADGDKPEVKNDVISADKGTGEEQLSPLASFYRETELLIEAQNARYMSQNELALAQYDLEAEMLKKKLDDGLISQQKYNDAIEKLDKNKKETSEKMMKEDLVNTVSMVASKSKKVGKIMQAAQIIQAVKTGYTAAVEAWKYGMSAGGPFAAAAYTAASLAKTGALISKIKGSGSSSSGGGGGGGATAATGSTQTQQSAPAQAAPSQPMRIFNVEFSGASTTSTQQTRNLLELINEQAGDNVAINLRGG